ncbi:GNAT family N-acetyltransferase [Phyllobacterium lublinensis]|jgi:predicted GNAT family acetyltransferase|uniref:GNAT family N-acetyltransferase n=1 Tax=Phyllobacterium lublinensis TaxID=2875708 RepID=UPI001CCA89FD|nr:GNAT family N-acetyltransferase [Phyllobacterium sp. 2063]MBZ9655320.1 GNAT family N-acetyltransferase [Phyllobacterium sp. 2063]
MTSEVKIEKEATDKGGRYVAIVSGHEAEMTFSRASPHLIIVDHTAVPDALRGQGVGQALALHAVEDARAGGWKIIPLCPFMRAQSLRHAEWADVIQQR